MRSNFRYQLFRAKRRDGKLYPKWRVKYFRDEEYLFSETGYTDKGRTEEKAKERTRELEHEAHLKAVGVKVPEKKPMAELVATYLSLMARKGGKQRMPAAPQHVAQCEAKLKWWTAELNLTSPADVRLADVEARVAAMPFSTTTRDLYVQRLNSFLNWCVKHDYLSANPLVRYQKHAPAQTYKRRALTLDEIPRLLAATTDRRSLVYRMALLTGMRRGELDSLKVGSVDWKAGKVMLEARSSKNRKPAEFYLPDEFLVELYAFCAGRRLDEKLLVNVSPSKSAQTLHRDLRKAGIPVETHEGRIDFHSLRVTFLTLVNELGEDVKTVQELARHADPRLTFGTYTKARENRLRAVVLRVHAQIPKTSPDIPRLGASHAGVTQLPGMLPTPDFIGSQAVGLAAPRAGR